MKREMMRWQWYQLDRTQIICTLLQRDNHANTSSLDFFTGLMLFLTPNQEHQSTEGNVHNIRMTALATSITEKLHFPFTTKLQWLPLMSQ